MTNSKKQAFTLIELAIVIAVISVILSISVSGLRSQSGASDIYSTTQKIDAIKTALETYRDQYGRYPCPSPANVDSSNANYGVAATDCFAACPSGLTCINNAANATLKDDAQGSVPFKTLGIAQELTKDSWDMKMTYAVDSRFTQDQNNCEGKGNLVVIDYSGNTVSNAVVYTVISHGSDNKGAYTLDKGTQPAACDAAANDGANCDNNNTFRSSNITKSNTNTSYYDDLIGFNTNSKFKTCPAGLTNCQAWFDASDKCTIQTNLGGVENLYDKSYFSNFVANQGNFTNRPDYPSATKTNGKNSITFVAGNSDALYASVTTQLALSNYTFVTVFRTSSTNSMFNVIANAASPGAGWWERFHGLPPSGSGTPVTTFNGQFKSYIYSSAGQRDINSNGTTTYNDGRAHVAISTVGGTGGYRLYIDGTQQTNTFVNSSSDNSGSNYFIILGLHNGYAGTTAGYEFLEYLYLNKELTSTERKSLELYMSNKWGILLN